MKRPASLGKYRTNENLRLRIGAWESVVNLLMGAEWLLSEGKI